LSCISAAAQIRGDGQVRRRGSTVAKHDRNIRLGDTRTYIDQGKRANGGNAVFIANLFRQTIGVQPFVLQELIGDARKNALPANFTERDDFQGVSGGSTLLVW